MNENEFFIKFELLADAPDAIERLRELLIHFAISGKLTNHDPSEKPVSLKLSGSPQDATKLPANWRSGLLGNVFTFEYGDNLPAQKRAETGEYPVYGSNGIVGTHSVCLTKEPVIIVGRKGSAGALNVETGPSWTTDVAYFVRMQPETDLRFTFYLFSALRLDKLGRGIKPGLNRKDAYELPIAIPPLSEQKRIAAKVDELMALCDQLEAQQKRREMRHVELVRAALARFIEAPTSDNLNLLFHPSFSIPPNDFRKTILTLAIHGKLVPHDPDEEPASQLLSRISAYKALLAEKRKFRGSITVSAMDDVEGDFELPSSWTWVRFGEIMINRDGERIPVSREERENRAKIYDYYGASGVIDKIDAYIFDKPLLLIGEDGANLINRSTPIAYIARGLYWVNNHAHVLDGISEPFLNYIKLHINAINLEPYVTGSAQPKMNQAKMNTIPIALPPLAEQERIVAKVDELMSLVDKLEFELDTSRFTATALLEALVQQLISKY